MTRNAHNTPRAHRGNESAGEGIRVGKRLLELLQNHALFVLLGLIATTVAGTFGLLHALGWRYDPGGTRPPSPPGTHNLDLLHLPHRDKPLRIALFGQLRDDLSDYGHSQLRGTLAGVANALQYLCGIDTDHVDDWYHWEAFDTSQLNLPDLRRSVAKAERDFDVVFGPITSAEALYVLFDDPVEIKVPTIFTQASTTKIRTHQFYGSLVYQVSHNIDSYIAQTLEYFGRFDKTRPSLIFSIYRADGLGRGAHHAAAKYASRFHMSYGHQELPESALSLSGSQYADEIDSTLSNVRDALSRAGSGALIIATEFEPKLSQVIAWCKKNAPAARIATVVSVEMGAIASGRYDDVFLAYSYTPDLFTTPARLRFEETASFAASKAETGMPSSARPAPWKPLSSIDAEVYDAAVFWFAKIGSKQLNLDCTKAPPETLYVTGFVQVGEGASQLNEGGLYLFQAKNGQMHPVRIDGGTL